jgi:hypothetical protein
MRDAFEASTRETRLGKGVVAFAFPFPGGPTRVTEAERSSSESDCALVKTAIGGVGMSLISSCPRLLGIDGFGTNKLDATGVRESVARTFVGRERAQLAM